MYSLALQQKSTHKEEVHLHTPQSTEASPRKSADVIHFSAGNPSVEHQTGVIHLYKQTDRPTSWQHLPPDRGVTLCVLAIPGDMGLPDFFRFVGSYLGHIKETRVLRQEEVERSVSMVLLRFSGQEAADNFFIQHNAAPFSSLEPDVICRVVFVKDVQLLDERQGAGLVPTGTEIPTCPVCLERLDEAVSGLATTVCNHKFHSDCLQQWGDTSCPVCRYCTQRGVTSKCEECQSHTDLWICLICGAVGCGRYSQQHARGHWEATQHCYTMELETGRVWDYVGDGYVHRLIQSHLDGKLVEVPAPQPSGSSQVEGGDHSTGCSQPPDAEKEELMLQSKLDAVALEYNHLLVSQLESQRQYFESQMEQLRAKLAEKDQQLESGLQRVKAETQKSQRQIDEESAQQKALQARLKNVQAKLQEANKERDVLQELNKSLMENQTWYKEQYESSSRQYSEDIGSKDSQIRDLQEQVRDFMIALETIQVASRNSEIQGGSVTVGPSSQQNSRRRRTGKK